MSRIPASAVAALAGLLPVCAFALGLGEIESKSYLNQPLAAEIPVFSEVPAELAGLKVALASQETFTQYGLQRPAFLGNLTFAVAPAARGAVIRITSPDPITEPFVTMLLEVQWPQGRLLREYTVLLDPPAFTGGAVRPPVQGAAAGPAPPPAAAATVPPPAPAATPAPPSRPAMPAAGDTHTVLRNETLWGIAERYRPASGADMNQVMMAIYRANPEAFAGNINRLNAGAVLRIPDAATVTALGTGEAASEVRRQNDAWRGSTAAAPARLELVPPREAPPAPAPAGAAPGGSATGAGASQAQVEESKRLLAVKDAELQALRRRVAELEKQQGSEVAVEPGPPAAAPPPPAAVAEAPPAVEAETEAEAPVEAPAAAIRPAKPVPARPRTAPSGGGILSALGDLVTNVWLWVAAAVVVLAALLIARRRAAQEEPLPYRAPEPRRREPATGAVVGATPAPRSDDMIVIEERVQATGGIERRAAPRTEEETPLERTISTDGPVNLDQADPLAEADFHMAYGLYDQAADLLAAAMVREPARRDLQLKLLDVFFVWENRDGFLKEARALRERLGTDSDPDWKRVIIMGKQLCPNEPMFAGAALPAADEMDLDLGGDGGTGSLGLGSDDGGLDFDLSGDEGLGADTSAPTEVAPRYTSAQTQELPTIEALGMDAGSSTMETPTIESPGLAASTMETPTIEAPAAGRTMETPTVEAPELAGTARLEGIGGKSDERHDETAEIDLEDLGLDLTGLDEAARDMATGLQESLPEDAAGVDLDLSGGAAAESDESTTEMENSPTINEMASSSGQARGVQLDDTAEQRGMADADSSMVTRGLGDTSGEIEALDIDLNLGEGNTAGTDLTATGLRAIGGRRPEDPTMTEVGTKLDLARAYIDMGDPDGARSILNEVLEEGDPDQRQEARQLLDGLDG